ncbi:hypothetical protein [Cryptosporangium aurantiacum]|uniref:hypothetical protein n=1 Tax=Cryptosporangium aurantiacum TaxID=134849 RepID=UPI0009321349|nr:hypothetical protein [Cryptosporangium aurantiacum]
MLLVVPVLLLLFGLLAGYLHFGVPIERSRVAVPAADAEPPRVLQAYLDALAANDVSTQKALWVPGRWPDQYANRLRTVAAIDVGSFVSHPKPKPGEDVGADKGLSAYDERAQVGAQYSLVYWPLMGGDDKDSGRVTAESFLLVRADSKDPWRIWALGFYG